MIRDAVIYQLRHNVHSALEDKHKSFGLGSESSGAVGAPSLPLCTLEEDTNCSMADDAEMTPMDIAES